MPYPIDSVPAGAAQPLSLQLGEGQFFTGLNWFEAATCAQLSDRIAERLLSGKGLLGSTAGGSFRAAPLLSRLTPDGQMPVCGDRLITGWEAVLQGEVRRADAALFALLLGGEARQRGECTELTPGMATALPCLPDLCWVGETLHGWLLVELRNARCLTGAGLRFAPGREGLVSVCFQAVCDDLCDTRPPFRLVFFEPLPAPAMQKE